jgi:hypothetical protein
MRLEQYRTVLAGWTFEPSAQDLGYLHETNIRMRSFGIGNHGSVGTVDESFGRRASLQCNRSSKAFTSGT